MSGNSFYSSKAIYWMRDFTSFANPIILLIIPYWILGWSKEYKILLVALLINEVLCSIIKLLYHKPRPDGQGFDGNVAKIDAGSFPSIHSSRITITYLTLFMSTSDIVMKCSFLIVIVLVYLSRVILKRHFPIDVYGGAIIGLIIFWVSQYF